MKLQPIQDRIVVKRIKAEEVTRGGIFLPDPEKPDQGEVVACGPGKRREDGIVEPLSVKVGDTVILGKYSGSTVKVDGEEYLVMREEDVFAVVEA
jgi:chaperonin GroES